MMSVSIERFSSGVSQNSKDSDGVSKIHCASPFTIWARLPAVFQELPTGGTLEVTSLAGGVHNQDIGKNN